MTVTPHLVHAPPELARGLCCLPGVPTARLQQVRWQLRSSLCPSVAALVLHDLLPLVAKPDRQADDDGNDCTACEQLWHLKLLG